jgi:hypothetical protein
MTLKRVNDFATQNPQKLDRDLAQLEDNVASEFDAVRRQLTPQLQVVTFRASTIRGIVAIQPDQQLSIDTAAATAYVVFPPLIPSNFGRRFVIILRTAGNPIVTSCQDTNVQCNATTFPTITVVGVTTFTCDAAGYYR